MFEYFKGIDVSRHNGEVDWKKAKDAGVMFAAIRWSVGDYYVDPRAEENLHGTAEAGIWKTVYNVIAPRNSKGKRITAQEHSDFFHKTFDEFVVDDMIEIEYKYEHDPHVCSMKWRIPDTKKVYRVRYTGSSAFALWWANYVSEVCESDCDCTTCQRERPCECGHPDCDVVGGSCFRVMPEDPTN